MFYSHYKLHGLFLLLSSKFRIFKQGNEKKLSLSIRDKSDCNANDRNKDSEEEA